MPTKKYSISQIIQNLLQVMEGNEKSALFHSGCFTGPLPSRFELLSGWGAVDELVIESFEDFLKLDNFIQQHQGKWIFSHVSYEAKDLIEKKLKSSHIDEIGFPLIRFFVPEFVLSISNDQHIQYFVQHKETGPSLVHAVPEYLLAESKLSPSHSSNISFSADDQYREKYLSALKKIKEHLKQGNIYEMNYCLPFKANGKLESPAALWWAMQNENQAPFAALYRNNNSWLLCCSPERFIHKEKGKIVSQPIKGTIKRSTSEENDRLLKEQLRSNEKEQAENVMIVDLVRNDLGKVAKAGSVIVDELFGIYSFKSVHQMISTIRAELKTNSTFSEILKATFPMGSMTGAPKVRAMEIIEELELFRRGLYSGSVGYIAPDGNFDFNVIIRSILYNSETQQIVFPAGGAITAGSDPEKEYEECLLKMQSMKHALSK